MITTPAYTIDREKRSLMARTNGTSRTRRFAGGARGVWYARYRTQRFAKLGS